MRIDIVSAVGAGPTLLAAFDDALAITGLANYNLIRLSSVIPPSSVIERADSTDPKGVWGDRLYVVWADERTAIRGHEVWAGVGWVQDTDTGRGLFVEHHGHSKLEVENDIALSLKGLMKTRDVDFGEIHSEVIGGICHGEPICAFVAACYQSEQWA